MKFLLVIMDVNVTKEKVTYYVLSKWENFTGVEDILESLYSFMESHLH